jgi:plasmid stabilization system protein ParE
MARRGRIKIIWMPKASAGLKEIVKFYRKRNQSPQYGNNLKKQIQDTQDRIRANPQCGEVLDGSQSRFVVIEHFVLLYELIGNEIIVHNFNDARKEHPFI